MPSFGFIGPTYQARSFNSDAERSINLFPEIVESGENASKPSKWVLYGTPGKQLYCVLDDAPVSCVVTANQQFSTDSVTSIYYAMSGHTLYAIENHYDGTTFTGVPTTIATGFPTQIINNTGGQLFPTQIIVINPNLLFVVAVGTAWVVAFGSPITGSALATGGLGYAVGDTGFILGSTGQDSKYTVLTVDASGAVLTYSLTPGAGYVTGTGIGTQPSGVQSGAGDGNFTINITSVGAAAWTKTQQVIPDSVAFPGSYITYATFMDQYVIVSLAGTAPDPFRRQFYISGLNDPSAWNSLDVGLKEGSTDPIVGVFAAYEYLVVFGLTTMEIWLDAPNGPAFPFQRMQGGGLLNTGCASMWTVCTINGTICWLGNDDKGQLVAFMYARGRCERISNFAVEYRWRNYDVTGSSAYTYEENGHYFWVVHFPIPDATWCCDTSTIGPDGKPVWHERLSWDGFNYHADIGRYHGWSFPVAHVVGDPNNGNLYIQSIDILSENCSCIRRLRASPHVFEERRRFITNRFRVYMQTGTWDVSLTPSVDLRLSNDGGWTWGPYLNMPIGLTGDYGHIVQWWRTGISANRIYELTICANIPVCIVDAFVELVPTVTR